MSLMFLSVLILMGYFAEPSMVLNRLPRHGGVYVVAHRGVHNAIPENTLAAYRKAIEVGADFVEIDIRETKDGALVSIHNATVDDYTSDAKGPVASFTLEELRSFDIGSRIAPEWAQERIPTLEEILNLCRGQVGIYLDLKKADPAKVVAVVKHYDMTQDVLWYAGAPQLREIQTICPECILMPDPGEEHNLQRTLEQFQPNVVASDWRRLTPSFVHTCHAAGAIIIVDDGGPSSWDDLLQWGVDGIQTDSVTELIQKLSSTNK